jgi:hypothetical protein
MTLASFDLCILDMGYNLFIYSSNFPAMRFLLSNIKECFNKILKKSEFGMTTVIIMVSLDVDALCALKILTVLILATISISHS